MNETVAGTISSVNTDENSTINTTIPANFTEMFRSATGTAGTTVAGLFDIQYRRWTFVQDGLIDKGEPYVRGDSRYIGSLITENDIILREGLIIDMRDNPGIGFRNHTVPMGLAHGGTWHEDILWAEPVTQCADTNLTIQMREEDSLDSFINNKTFYHVDRGAFRDLDRDALITRPWIDNQTLDLFGRAYRAARQFNVLTAEQLNVTLPFDGTLSTRPVREDSGAPAYMYSFPHVNQILKTSIDGGLAGGGIGGPQPTIPDPTSANATPPWIPRYDDGVRKRVALNYTAIGMFHYICHYRLANSVRSANVSRILLFCDLIRCPSQ